MRGDIIFGKKPILEAIDGRRKFEKILVAKGSDFFKEVYAATKGMNIPIQVVPEEKLNRITRKNHQGVIGLIGFVDYQNLENVLAAVYESGETPLFIALDGVTDVGNMGAIARSAYALGAHAIIVPEKGSALINGVAVKASAGAIEKINFCKVKNFKDTLKNLQLNGLALYSATLSKDAVPIAQANYTIPCCVVMGNEEKGVGRTICDMSDQEIYIPMVNNFDSLNVSVATGIILHETLKQRTS